MVIYITVTYVSNIRLKISFGVSGDIGLACQNINVENYGNLLTLPITQKNRV